MNYDKVKAEIDQLIIDHPSAKIYVSEASLWWATNINELEEATRIGLKLLNTAAEGAKAAQKHNPKEHARIGNMQMTTNRAVKASEIRLCPAGTQVVEKSLAEFWPNVVKKADVFGKHGLKAFIACKHELSGGKIYNSWGEVNSYIDGIEFGTPAAIPVQNLRRELSNKWLIGALLLAVIMLVAMLLTSCTKEVYCYKYNVTFVQVNKATGQQVLGTMYSVKDTVICTDYYESETVTTNLNSQINLMALYTNKRK